jgi:nicotinamide-nucleotide amidase
MDEGHAGARPWTRREVTRNLVCPAVRKGTDLAVPNTDPTKHVDDIAELAKQHGFRVGAAESLTGGAVSSALAMGEEAAEWYHGCVVSYAPTVKHDLLGVTPGPLVTERCAIEMVTGVAKVLQVDAAVSTTGAGGPEPEEGEPPGTVHVGVYVRGEVTTHLLRLEGDPGEVVEAATEKALGLLCRAMRAAC